MVGLPCRIVLRGEVNDRFQHAFVGMRLSRQGERTELSGTLADRSELKSLLDQLFDLGMEVISVQTDSGVGSPDAPNPGPGPDGRRGGESPG